MQTHRVVRAWLVLLGLMAMGVTAALAAAPAGKTLRYKCEPGRRAVYGVKFSVKAKIKASDGTKSQISQSAQTTSEVEYLGDTSSGDFGVEGAVQGGTYDMKADGEEIDRSFDDNAAKYVVNRLGRIKSVTWLSEDPHTDEEHNLWTPLPHEAFLLSGAGILPEKPVKKGDTWKGSVRIPGSVEGEDETIEYKSTLLGEEKFNGTVCSKIQTKATTYVKLSEEAPDGSGKVVLTARDAAVYTWLFDPERGMIVSSGGTMNVTVVIKAVMDGSELASATITEVINENYKLKEINGEPMVR